MKHLLSFCLTLVTATLILTITPACKKTVVHTITDTVTHAWQMVPYFNMNASPALNSVNIGDTTLLVGGNYMYTQIPVNHPQFITQSGYFLHGADISHPIQGTPFLTPSLCAFTDGTSLMVQSVPVYSQYSQDVYTPTYTTGFYPILPQSYFPYPSQASPAADFPIIRAKYGLLPVEVNYTTKQAHFDLVRMDSSKFLTPNGFGDSPTVQHLTLTPAAGTIGFQSSGYYCASFFDKFFVDYGGQFFRIDTAGNVKAFGYAPTPYSRFSGVANMFTVNNMLCVNSGGVIFASTDQGETWNVLQDYSQTSINILIFRNVGNDLYATAAVDATQVWRVIVNGNTFTFSEINNDGLQSNLITSLTRCGKYAFATTPAGIFYRDTALFNQLKTPVR